MAKPFHAQRAGAGPRADATGRQAKAPPGAGPFGLALLCENRRPLRKEVRNEWRPSRGSTFKFTSAPPSFLPSLRDEAAGGGAQEQRQWASASLSSSEGLRPHETLRPGEGAFGEGWGGAGAEQSFRALVPSSIPGPHAWRSPGVLVRDDAGRARARPVEKRPQWAARGRFPGRASLSHAGSRKRHSEQRDRPGDREMPRPRRYRAIRSRSQKGRSWPSIQAMSPSSRQLVSSMKQSSRVKVQTESLPSRDVGYSP